MEKRKNMGNILLRPTLCSVGIALIFSAAFAACSNQTSDTVQAPSATKTDETTLATAPAASVEQPAIVCDSVAAADSVQSCPASIKASEPEKAPEPAKEVVEAKPRNGGDNGIYSSVEHQAEFPGGEGAMLQFINKNLQYPKDAGSAGIQGRVLIDFVVEKDGSLSNFGVLRSPNESLSQEAIRVAQLMPKWKPGEMQGKIVRSRYVLPVQFHL